MNDEEFFRRAWLTMKAISNSRIRKKMDEIECGIEGIRVRQTIPNEEKKNESSKIVPL